MKLRFHLLAILAISFTAAAQDKPNIVVILADDFGYGSAGCYGADPKLVRTPNLDRLAREGRRFTDANTTSSVCSPTRYSLMTGRYCWRTSLSSGVLGTFSPLHIEPSRLNLASLLKGAGYQTAAIGKWHLGYGKADDSPKWQTDYTAELSPGPLDLGFDYHFGVPSNHGDLTGVFVENRFVYGLRAGKIPPGVTIPPVPESPDFKDTYTKEDTESARRNPLPIQAPRRVNERVMPVLTGKAAHWIGQQKAGTPFFLYFTPVGVHNPVTPDKDLAGQSAAGLYGDWIHELDRSVGRILEALDQHGFAENTLVIFTSDNGGVASGRPGSAQALAEEAGLAINGSLRGRKHSVWEGGFKVPFIVRWPGHAPAGTVCPEMVSMADILATTAAVAGQKLPPAGEGAEDSYNILPAILGQNSAPVRPDLIVHSSDGVFALRQGPWKWIEGVPVDATTAASRKVHGDEFRPQLYRVRDDPAETRDVSADHPEVAREMQALLARYRDGGYSRELPPVAQKVTPVLTPLGPLAGNVLLNEPLDHLPEKPWTVVLGNWSARDGALWGTQKSTDQTGAVLRAPLAMRDGVIQYEVCFQGANRHTLVIETGARQHSVRVEVSRAKLGLTKNPSAGESKEQTEPIAAKPLKLAAGEWYPVRVTLRGKEAIVEAAGATITGSHAIIGEPKGALSLKVFGESAGFRKLTAAEAP